MPRSRYSDSSRRSCAPRRSTCRSIRFGPRAHVTCFMVHARGDVRCTPLIRPRASAATTATDMRSMLGLKAPASGSELRARGYEAGARMGSGQFGYAVLVTKACPSGAPESRTYVAKLQKFRHLPSEDKERMQREVDAMRSLAEAGHPYLVRFRESFVEGDKLCIIMDYCDSGDLAVRIKRQREVGHGQQFREAQVQRWLAQLIAGLDFLHAMHVLHRDIKPSSERLPPPPGYPCARVRGESLPHPSPRRRRACRPLPPPGQRAQDRRPRAVEADPGGHRRRAEAHAVRLSRVPRARGAHVPGVRRQGRHLGGGLHAVRGDDAPPRLHRRRHGGDPRQSRLRGARAPPPPARHREAAADPAAPLRHRHSNTARSLATGRPNWRSCCSRCSGCAPRSGRRRASSSRARTSRRRWRRSTRRPSRTWCAPRRRRRRRRGASSSPDASARDACVCVARAT